MIRGRIPQKIRDEVLAKVKSGQRVKDVAEQYGVGARTVYDWLRKDTGEDVVSILKYNKLKRENKELKRLIGELTLNMSLGKKIKLVSESNIKKLVAEALGINPKNIYRQTKLEIKDELLKQDILRVHLD